MVWKKSCRQKRGQYEFDSVSGCSWYLIYKLSADVSVKTLTDFTPQRAVHSQRYQLPSWRWTPWWNRTACRSQHRPVSWALLLYTIKTSQINSQGFFLMYPKHIHHSGKNSLTGYMYFFHLWNRFRFMSSFCYLEANGCKECQGESNGQVKS